MTAKTWVGTAGGSWTGDANWLPFGAATSGDDATIAGPAVTYVQASTIQTITGPGSARSLALPGNTALAGTVTVGSLEVGEGSTPGGLTVAAGGTVATGSLNLNAGTVAASGTGARLTVGGTLNLGAGNGPAQSVALTARDGGTVQVADLTFQETDPALTTITVDDASTLEVGTAGGAMAGQFTIDAGKDLHASGSVSASKGVVNGGVLSTTGTLNLYGNVTGAGSLRVGAGAVLNLRGTTDVTTEGVTFTGSGGRLGIVSYSAAAASRYASNLAGAITGFATGDVIAVSQGVVGTVTATYTATGLGSSNSKWLLTVVGSAVLHGVIQALDGASGHPCCWRALGLRGLP